MEPSQLDASLSSDVKQGDVSNAKRLYQEATSNVDNKNSVDHEAISNVDDNKNSVDQEATSTADVDNKNQVEEAATSTGDAGVDADNPNEDGDKTKNKKPTIELDNSNWNNDFIGNITVDKFPQLGEVTKPGELKTSEKSKVEGSENKCDSLIEHFNMLCIEDNNKSGVEDEPAPNMECSYTEKISEKTVENVPSAVAVIVVEELADENIGCIKPVIKTQCDSPSSQDKALTSVQSVMTPEVDSGILSENFPEMASEQKVTQGPSSSGLSVDISYASCLGYSTSNLNKVAQTDRRTSLIAKFDPLFAAEEKFLDIAEKDAEQTERDNKSSSSMFEWPTTNLIPRPRSGDMGQGGAIKKKPNADTFAKEDMFPAFGPSQSQDTDSFIIQEAFPGVFVLIGDDVISCRPIPPVDDESSDGDSLIGSTTPSFPYEALDTQLSPSSSNTRKPKSVFSPGVKSSEKDPKKVSSSEEEYDDTQYAMGFSASPSKSRVSDHVAGWFEQTGTFHSSDFQLPSVPHSWLPGSPINITSHGYPHDDYFDEMNLYHQQALLDILEFSKNKNIDQLYREHVGSLSEPSQEENVTSSTSSQSSNVGSDKPSVTTEVIDPQSSPSACSGHEESQRGEKDDKSAALTASGQSLGIVYPEVIEPLPSPTRVESDLILCERLKDCPGWWTPICSSGNLTGEFIEIPLSMTGFDQSEKLVLESQSEERPLHFSPPASASAQNILGDSFQMPNYGSLRTREDFEAACADIRSKSVAMDLELDKLIEGIMNARSKSLGPKANDEPQASYLGAFSSTKPRSVEPAVKVDNSKEKLESELGDIFSKAKTVEHGDSDDDLKEIKGFHLDTVSSTDSKQVESMEEDRDSNNFESILSDNAVSKKLESCVKSEMKAPVPDAEGAQSSPTSDATEVKSISGFSSSMDSEDTSSDGDGPDKERNEGLYELRMHLRLACHMHTRVRACSDQFMTALLNELQGYESSQNDLCVVRRALHNELDQLLFDLATLNKSFAKMVTQCNELRDQISIKKGAERALIDELDQLRIDCIEFVDKRIYFEETANRRIDRAFEALSIDKRENEAKKTALLMRIRRENIKHQSLEATLKTKADEKEELEDLIKRFQKDGDELD